jgi:fimbrial isopeptide formation D2 family protein
VLQALVAMLLAAAMQPGTIMPVSAQPPTLLPPPIYKMADKGGAAVGDPVRFTIVVVNAPEEEDSPTWYQVVVSDEIHPALRIDNVAVTPAADQVAVEGNKVVVRVNSLGFEESFVITIDCTLGGSVSLGDVIQNMATLEYENEAGQPQEPIDSDPVILRVIERTWLPAIFRESAFN